MPEDPNLPPETDPVPPVTDPPAEQPSEPTPPAVDYEKKFSESSRENQILRERLAAEERARQELTNQTTDSELRTAFPDWDLLDDTQKSFARRTYGAEKNSANALRIAKQFQTERQWNTSIELVISSDPALQGKEQAFKEFASKPQYKNVPMEVLVPAFLQKQGGAPAAPRPTPRPGLEPGNGGPRTPDKPKGLSATELATLRTTDERAYTEYVKTHEIDVDSL